MSDNANVGAGAERNWTPAPWGYPSEERWEGIIIAGPNGEPVLKEYSYQCQFISQEDCDRAIACVNACKDFGADPAKEIAELRERAEAYKQLHLDAEEVYDGLNVLLAANKDGVGVPPASKLSDTYAAAFGRVIAALRAKVEFAWAQAGADKEVAALWKARAEKAEARVAELERARNLDDRLAEMVGIPASLMNHPTAPPTPPAFESERARRGHKAWEYRATPNCSVYWYSDGKTNWVKSARDWFKSADAAEEMDGEYEIDPALVNPPPPGVETEGGAG